MRKSAAARTDFYERMKAAGLYDLVSVMFFNSQSNADEWRVEAIWSEVERGKGHASRALNLLCEIADQHQLQLTLVPHWLAYDLANVEDIEEEDRLHALNEQKLGNAQLKAWYERRGFACTGVVEGDDQVMTRIPLAPKPALRDSQPKPKC